MTRPAWLSLDNVPFDRLGWPLVMMLLIAAAMLFVPKISLLFTDEAALLSQAGQDLTEGRLDEAEASAFRAIEKQPGSGAAQLLLARIAIARRDGAGAAMLIDKAVRFGLPGERAHAHLGEARMLMSDWAGAEEALNARIDESDLGLANRLLAILAARRGALDDAQELLDLSREYDDGSAQLWADYAYLYRQKGDAKAARKAARRALAIDDGNLHALEIGGELAADLNGPEAALSFYERGLTRVPGDLRLLQLKAATLAKAGRYRDVMGVATTMLEDTPHHASAWYLFGWLAARAGDNELAATMLDRAAAKMGDLPAYRYLSGTIDYRTGQYREAANAFAAIISAHPGNAKARMMLASTHLKTDDPDAAWRTIAPIADDPSASGEVRRIAMQARSAASEF